MTKIISRHNKQYYQCEECALFYGSKEFAEKCQAWCKEHKICNLDIIKYAITLPNGTMSAKAEREALKRQEKNDARRQNEQNQKLKRILKWAIVVVSVIVVGYGLVFLARQGQQSRPGEAFAIQGQEHIAVGANHLEYSSNPPTSGPHYAQPVNWGVYQIELPDEQIIHNLEHGGIWISYKPDIDPTIKVKLESIGNNYRGSVVVVPRAKNDSMIAVASWGRLEKLDNFDEAKITNFIDANKNKSPEPLAR